MRITSRTLAPDDVGSVDATVDGHGWVEGLGAPCPGQRHDALQLAPRPRYLSSQKERKACPERDAVTD